MRSLFAVLAMLLAAGTLVAQSIKPAQPADPGQARPAVPMGADALTPMLATPSATNAEATSTNATPAAPVVAISVIAESSLRAVLQELAQAWADGQDNNPQVPLTLTNSGTILSKAQAGAGFDVVISASVDDMKLLTDKGMLLTDGQRSLARNTVVVYGRRALVKDDDLEWFDLIGDEWKKVALGRPDQVASGHLAQRALQKHNLLDDEHKGLFTYALTDGLALNILQRDQADAVFALKTDVAHLAFAGFEVFPVSSDDAPPVFYTAAVCRLSKNPAAARGFIDFCGGDAAKPVWVKYGFETN